MGLAQRDAYFWQEIGRIAEERKYSLRDLFENFPAYIQMRFLTDFDTEQDGAFNDQNDKVVGRVASYRRRSA